MYRRYPLLLICIVCLSSCGQIPGGSQLMAAFKPLFGTKKPFMTQESISKLPYAAIAAKIGDGPEAMMILGRMDGANHHYFAQDKAIIVLTHGRITRSYGLPYNLWYTQAFIPAQAGIKGINSRSDIFHQDLQKIATPVTETRLIDLNRDGLQNIEVHATFSREGQETLNIYGRDYNLTRICETVNVPYLKWCYHNTYWVFAHNGLVMRSIQHIHPNLSPVQVTVLRPAG